MQTLLPQINVWAEMKHAETDMQNMEITAAWVENHQDDGAEETELSFEARMNIAMDHKYFLKIHKPNPTLPIL